MSFRTVTPDFSVAPQLAPEDLARAAAAGFKTVINNRPDGEAPGQMTNAEAAALAQAAGLEYRALPMTSPTQPVVAATAALLEEVPGPVLAYCRSGTRSVTAWALAQALAGKRQPDEIIALAEKAGYDLSEARGALVQLSGS